MKTNKEQEKNAFAEDSITFECKTDLQPRIVHSGPTTGYTFNPDFSWEMDLNPLLDATSDDKNYVQKLFNDATFRYHELYKLELLGDK